MAIHPQTKLGPVHLQVADLNNLVNYYTTLGLHLRRRSGKQAVLGAGELDLLVLDERADGRRVRGTSGLYHFAILLPSRPDLGRALRHFGHSAIRVGGASDHAVSEALYLTDPEGNGIEVYRDRARSEWQYPNGQLLINTTPFDVEGVLAAGDENQQEWNGFPDGTVIGHIHLHVGSVDAAESFYRDALGLDLISRYGPSATFLSAGGYHHHIGANTWAGVGIPAAPENAWGLNYFTIELPDTQALAQSRSQLERAGVAVAEREEGLFVRDAAGNGILLQTAA